MSRRATAGFSLLEMLLSMTIMTVVVGSMFLLVDPGQSTSRAQLEVADMQQRMRVAADMVAKDLIMAGAGWNSGAGAGTLSSVVPAIRPYRTGQQSPDGGLTFFADRISITSALPDAPWTTISDSMPPNSAELKVDAELGCPSGDELCGFAVGMQVMIFDDTGTFDVFTITNVQTSALHLQHRGQDLSKAYSPTEHARIGQLDSQVYYLDTANRQLHHYDGLTTDLPLVDNCVGVRFRYFGDPNPPASPRPTSGQSNCLFDAAGNSTLPVLPSGGSSLVELTPAMLTDGPVCGQAPNQFDADLYRVRKVGVQLRMQAGSPDLRGSNPAGQTIFQNPGTAPNAYRRVPDFVMSFEVTPRNMNLTR
jgi:hypothetical protein